MENGQLCSETDAAPCVLDAPGEVVMVLGAKGSNRFGCLVLLSGGPSKSIDFPRFVVCLVGGVNGLFRLFIYYYYYYINSNKE